MKVVKASPGCVHKYENLKRKLYNCKVNIYFHRQCLQKQLTPNYVRIKVPNTTPAFKYKHKVPNIRIKDDIKYLYIKTQHLKNQQIYHLHLTLANSLNNTWPYIQHTTEEKLEKKK